MDDSSDGLMKKEFLSVRERDPWFHKEDFWHTHIDYEIYLHTNSMCFQKKTSCVRRRYSEFVWLHQRLQDNVLLVQVPKLSPAKPFFSLNNRLQVVRRMEGLQKFLEALLKIPLMLSDSHLHLFLQSQLSVSKMEACVQGQTSYSVTEAIQRCVYNTHFSLKNESQQLCNSDDGESTSSSGLGKSAGPTPPIEMSSQNGNPAQQFLAMVLDPEAFRCVSSTPESQQDTHT